MTIREKVDLLLQERRFAELTKLTFEKPSALKYLYRLFYHPYGLERWLAIEALGQITREMARENPEGVREILRRLLWAMNDESGTASWSSPEAIGEIIYHHPDLFKEYVSIVVYASEEEIFHRGIAWAIGRIAQRRPDLVVEYVPLLSGFLSHPKPDVRGHAAWALGQMGSTAGETQKELHVLLEDTTVIEMYQTQSIVQRKINDLSREAIERISNAGN